ncbi:hypothetical protein VCR15J5_320016 [Vibrio crassostreae]|nr:hypothetical protein VCR15J5_320016 [Vibrio crassostreae]
MVTLYTLLPNGDDDGRTTDIRYGAETTNNGDEPIRKEWI